MSTHFFRAALRRLMTAFASLIASASLPVLANTESATSDHCRLALGDLAFFVFDAASFGDQGIYGFFDPLTLLGFNPPVSAAFIPSI